MSYLLHNDAGVSAAQSMDIHECRGTVCATRLPWNEIQIAGGVGVVEVGRRWNGSRLQRQQGCRDLERTCGCERIAQHAFDGGDRYLIGAGAEHLFDH